MKEKFIDNADCGCYIGKQQATFLTNFYLKLILPIFILILAFTFSACGGGSGSDDDDYNGPVIINGVEWADCNVDSYQTFAAKPDMYTQFYKWGNNTAWSAIDPTDLSGWASSGYDSGSTWAPNPCPSGWRLPTKVELEALCNKGSTWADANTRGNAVAGRFFGSKHKTASLPDNMGGAIFLPASGSRNNSDGSLQNQGIYGLYFSSSSTYTSEVIEMMFDSSIAHVGSHMSYAKSFGLNIRPVRTVTP